MSKGTHKHKVALTETMVYARTKTDRLSCIQTLNVWGCDLSDVSLIRQMPNLRILSLAVNKITSLRDLSDCYNLEELYLRDNRISDITELGYLCNLKKLRKLSLSSNPCCNDIGYIDYIRKCIPWITELDGNSFSPHTSPLRERPSPILESPLEPSITSPVRPVTSPVRPVTSPVKTTSPIKAIPVKPVSENILFAAMALVRELDHDALQILKIRIDEQLGN